MHLHLNDKKITAATSDMDEIADDSVDLTSNTAVAQQAESARAARARAGEDSVGQPLPEQLQGRLERSFDADFSSVRVHQGDHVSALGAQAYARGNQLHFAPGEYQPETRSGQELIGHELTHVAQQAQGRVSAPAQAKGIERSSRHEREADAVGAQVARGGAAPAHLQGIDASTAATAVAQCRLPDDDTYRVDTTDAKLVTIADKVKDYNAIAGARKGSSQLQVCFNKLQQVERAIYDWFKTATQALTGNDHRLKDNPRSALVRSLHTAIETEQQELIQQSKANKNVLPFDTTGIAKKDLPALRNLWQDIVNNRGKIKVVGSAEYNKRIYGELAKLLSTPTGRSMLKMLNTEQLDNPSDAKAKMTNVYIGETTDQLPDEVKQGSPELEEQQRSEAQPLGVDDNLDPKKLENLTEVTESEIDPGNKPDPKKYPPVGGGEYAKIREYAWDPQYKGFTHNGKKYEFNRNNTTGAFVTSFPGIAVQPGKGSGNEIFSPGWVTLGHELGHVANMRTGSTTLKTKGTMVDSLVGGHNNDKWDNTEELLNIENVENSLRSDAGLHERDGHRPPPWALTHALNTRNDLKRPLEQLHANDNSWYHDPEWTDVFGRIRRMKVVATLDDNQVDALRQEVAQLVPTKANALLPGYLQQITSSQQKADAIMASLGTQADKDRTFLWLHARTDRFEDIKKKLHYGTWARRNNNAAQRLAGRATRLDDLVQGRAQL